MELAPVTSFVKEQRIHQIGYITRREVNETVRAVRMETPRKKISRQTQEKMEVEEDLRMLEIEN